MARRDALTKALATIGTVLAWFPVAATVLIAVIVSVQAGEFHLDLLMPAELFPAALAGGALLLWAALRARARVRPVGWSLGLAVLLLVLSMAMAVILGLASGASEPVGWRLLVVNSLMAGYVLGLVALGVTGAMLIGDVYRRA